MPYRGRGGSPSCWPFPATQGRRGRRAAAELQKCEHCGGKHPSDRCWQKYPHLKNKDKKDKKKDKKGGGKGKKSAKKCKTEPTLVPAACTDGMHQCIFVDGECIPLWPQYLHKTAEGNFLRVDRMESWVIQLMVASRKSVLRGYEPQTHCEKNKPFAMALVKSVCDELLHEFRRAVVIARRAHRVVW